MREKKEMITLYLLCGIVLVAVFAGIIVYFYSPRRKKKVEEPKYRVFEDDD